MSSTKIKFEAGQIYHVWTHANGDENIFRADSDFRSFLTRYGTHLHPVVETFAYCLMPNHLHLMVRIRSEQETLSYLREIKKVSTLQGFDTLGGFSKCISRQFGDLLNGYTQSYNYKYDRKGSLFIPNFKRKLIDSESYFGRLIVYIHNNPVYHGFVVYPHEWRYSSYLAYAQRKITKINIIEGLDWLGGPRTFYQLHRELQQEKLAIIFEK